MDENKENVNELPANSDSAGIPAEPVSGQIGQNVVPEQPLPTSDPAPTSSTPMRENYTTPPIQGVQSQTGDSAPSATPFQPNENFAINAQNMAVNIPQKIINWKKIIIISSLVLFCTILLGVGGYFGYLFYTKSSDARILNKVSQNILKAKNLKVDFRVGTSGFSVKGELFVDKEQDLKGSLKNDLIPLEMIYIKEKDTGYMSEFSLMGEENSDNNKFTEYKNLSKAIEKYGLKEMGLDSLDPNKNYFNAENVKYFKRVGDEKIDGKSLYKYSFEPDDKAKEEGLKKANEALKKVNTSSYYIKNPSFKTLDSKIYIWVGANDFNVYKVDGETSGAYSYEAPDYKCLYSTDDDSCSNTDKKIEEQKFSFEWALDFDYSYNENIELPKDAKIDKSVDLSNIEQENQKTKLRADGRTIQTALEGYYLKNNSKYPANLEALKGKYIPESYQIDFANFEYQLNQNEYTLIIKFNGEKIDELKS